MGAMGARNFDARTAVGVAVATQKAQGIAAVIGRPHDFPTLRAVDDILEIGMAQRRACVEHRDLDRRGSCLGKGDPRTRGAHRIQVPLVLLIGVTGCRRGRIALKLGGALLVGDSPVIRDGVLDGLVGAGSPNRLFHRYIIGNVEQGNIAAIEGDGVGRVPGPQEAGHPRLARRGGALFVHHDDLPWNVALPFKGLRRHAVALSLVTFSGNGGANIRRPLRIIFRYRFGRADGIGIGLHDGPLRPLLINRVLFRLAREGR